MKWQKCCYNLIIKYHKQSQKYHAYSTGQEKNHLKGFLMLTYVLKFSLYIEIDNIIYIFRHFYNI